MVVTLAVAFVAVVVEEVLAVVMMVMVGDGHATEHEGGDDYCGDGW